MRLFGLLMNVAVATAGSSGYASAGPDDSVTLTRSDSAIVWI